MFLTAIEDQPPQVEVTLKGIGSAVTPDVMVPIRGKISDDYGVAKRPGSTSRSTSSGDERDVPFALGKGGAVEQQIDFRNERAEKTGLEIKPGDKLFLAVKAVDKFDLRRRAARRDGRPLSARRGDAGGLARAAGSPRNRPAAAVRTDHRRNDADARFALAGEGQPLARCGQRRRAGGPARRRRPGCQAAHAGAKGAAGGRAAAACACSGPCSRARNRWPKCWAWRPAFWTFARS